MPLCKQCTVLTIDEINGCDLLFKPDLSALKLSAAEGCEFCALCWYALNQGRRNPEAKLQTLLQGKSLWPEQETWTPTIWLHGGHFFEGGASGAYIEVSVGIGLGAFVDGKPEPYYNVGTTVSGRVEVYRSFYSAENHSTKYRLNGRRTTADRDPQVYMHLIQDWLHLCRTKHPQCSLGMGDFMPTRIIDVGDPARGEVIRLVSTHGLSEPYIALSYCWGAAGSDILTLRTETHIRMTQEIAMSELAKTHQDAVSLTRALNIRYIWIDALCIIQGDIQDWSQESRTMAQVYSNAACTIVAGRSSDSRNGFISNNLAADNRPPPCKLPVDTEEGSKSLIIDCKRSSAIGPVSTRGWCFQERILSRRAVIFGDEQLQFHCMERAVYENGEVVKPKLWQALLLPSVVATKPKEDETTADRVIQAWYGLLFEFTTCHLSHPHDIFAAIAAIAQQTAHILKSRYLAGIWECDIMRGLLWRPRDHECSYPLNKIPATRPKPTKLTDMSKPLVRAPSWSWAAVEGPVDHEIFSPPRIARYKDPAFGKIHHIYTNPVKWTLDVHCGPGALHMPACKLELMGIVVYANVFQRPIPNYTKKLTRPHRVLLGPREGVSGKTGDSNLDPQVIAMGFFDISDEKKGVHNVWCLLVVQDKGLMLRRNEDGTYSRLGWFRVEQERAFLEQKEEKVSLV